MRATNVNGGMLRLEKARYNFVYSGWIRLAGGARLSYVWVTLWDKIGGESVDEAEGLLRNEV